MDHGIGDGNSIGPVQALPPPPPPPQPPVHLHKGIEAPKKIADVTPAYPSIAQAAHVKGMVILEAVIDVHGNVTSVQVLRSVPLLDQAAVDAVRQWRYTPARLNGQPVPVVRSIPRSRRLASRAVCASISIHAGDRKSRKRDS